MKRNHDRRPGAEAHTNEGVQLNPLSLRKIH